MIYKDLDSSFNFWREKLFVPLGNSSSLLDDLYLQTLEIASQ